MSESSTEVNRWSRQVNKLEGGGVKMNDEVIGLLLLAALICNALNGFVTERNVC